MADAGADTRDVETGSDASSGTGPSTRGRRRPSRWAVAVATLAVLLVAMPVGTAVLVAHDQEVNRRPEQRQAALDVARKVAGEVISTSGDNAREKIASLIQESTGPFHDQLTRNTAAFEAALQSAQVVSSGAVAAAGLETFDPATASALVVIAGTVANSDVPQGQPTSFRLAMQLRHEGDRWLVSAVEVLP
jgi:Mce-associated membrane protein